jgi:hypothetical protein
VHPIVWCLCNRGMRQRAEYPAVRTGMRPVCNFTGGVSEGAEKTGVWIRREKDGRRKKMRKDANVVGLNDASLPWLGDASLPAACVISRG